MTDVMPSPAVPAAPEPAGFWVRGGALILDMAIMMALAMSVTKLAPKAGFLAGIVLGGFVKLGYQTILVGGWGATFGKMAAGVRVTRMDGSPVGHGRAFGRALAHELSALMMDLGYVPAAFTPDKRALHDFMAGTRVVYEPGVGRGRRAAFTLLGASFPLIVLGVTAFFVLMTIPALQEQKGDYAAAARSYGRLIRLRPGNAALWNNRCWTRALAGVELDEALTDCETSLKLGKTANAYDSRGMVYLKMGKYTESISSYDEALAMKPKHPYSLYGRGLAKLRSGDPAGGKADLDAALEADARVGKAFSRYGLDPEEDED